MIHKVENHYVISSYHSWKPGVYDSERTARYAFRFPDEHLQKLQESIHPNGVITFDMLRDLKAALILKRRSKKL